LIHSDKHFAAKPTSITTDVSSDRSATAQLWRLNLPIWSWPGPKRATGSLAPDYGEGYESIPKPGDIVMMLDGEGRPRFIWRTTEVTIKPLSQVDDAFAWVEGEDNRTRNWWLAAHRRYFGRQASREGFQLEVERFEVVWTFDWFSGKL